MEASRRVPLPAHWVELTLVGIGIAARFHDVERTVRFGKQDGHCRSASPSHPLCTMQLRLPIFRSLQRATMPRRHCSTHRDDIPDYDNNDLPRGSLNIRAHRSFRAGCKLIVDSSKQIAYIEV